MRVHRGRRGDELKLLLPLRAVEDQQVAAPHPASSAPASQSPAQQGQAEHVTEFRFGGLFRQRGEEVQQPVRR